MKKKNLRSIFMLTLMLTVTTGSFAQEIVWENNFGGSGWDYYYGVTAVSDGSVAVGYSYKSSFENGDWADVTGKGSDDAIIVKYDNSGSVVWKKNFGGSGKDCFTSVTAVSDGIVAVGHSEYTSFGNGDWTGIKNKGGIYDATIVKYDNSGNVVWKKNFGGSSPEYFKSITTVSDGIVVVGFSAEGAFGNGDWSGIIGKGGEDAIIVKYDNSGNVVWKKNFGGWDDDCYLSVTAVSDGVVAVGTSFGGLYGSFGNGDWTGVTGKGSSDAIIVKYNSSGSVVWKKNFGGMHGDRYLSVTTLSDGIVATGYSVSGSFDNGDWVGVTAKGTEDAIIVKYNNSGNVVWKQNFGGSKIDCFTSVITTSDGIVAVGNSTSSTSGDWIGSWGYGDYDAIIVKYNNSGNVVWKKRFGGSDEDYFESVTTVSNNVVVAGYSRSISYSGNGGSDAITVKYTTNSVGIIETGNETSLLVYPNPTDGEFIIEDKELTINNVEIFDIYGKKQSFSHLIFTSSNHLINLSHLSAGIYFVKICTEAGEVVKKVVKE